MKCPLCDEDVIEEIDNIFDHMIVFHEYLETHELLIGLLEVLAKMDIDSFDYLQKVREKGKDEMH